jgi:hypothetical protein
MALTRTAITAALPVDANTISVVSAAGIAAGDNLQIDAEFLQVQTSYVSGTVIPVLRGRNGSATLPHAIGAPVVAGKAGDFADPPAQSAASVNLPANRVREIKSVGTGTTVLPIPKPGTDLFLMFTGTVVIAATLPNPGKDNDGDILSVANTGSAAHTITYAGGFGGVAASDVVTFPAAPATAAFVAIACNERWINFGGSVVPA